MHNSGKFSAQQRYAGFILCFIIRLLCEVDLLTIMYRLQLESAPRLYFELLLSATDTLP